ncbi:MAG TPA: ComEA family DNA-binding protein [Nocardioides sp.]|nr:ComEA family DNA-binding protein [Nocardioides sp.]
MRTRRSLEHDAALSRRLAQLGDELSVHPGGLRPARPQLPATDLTTAPWWDDHTRPAAPRRPPPPPAPRALPAATPRAAAPGRHAAQRPCGPAGLGPAQLTAVAVVVAVALAVTCWWLVHGSAHPAPGLAAAPAPGLVSASPAVAQVGDAVRPGGAAASSAATPATVTIDVAGKVRHPGIAVLDAGSRVVDAIKAAGGARPGVDLTGLNLARVLVDGEQVVVGVAAPAGAAAEAVPPAGGPSGPATLVNLNTATEAELDTLPDVGPVTAASILQWRDQHGGFSSVDELLEVDGIGEVTLGKLAPYVTV